MKRIPIWLLILFFAAGPLSAKVMAQEIGYNIPIQIGGSCVLIGADGTERVPPGEYSMITSISPKGTPADEELFSAMPLSENGRNCLLLNAKGEALTKADYQYLICENGVITFLQDGLYGVMDYQLKTIVPCAYTNIIPNGEGGYLALTSDPYDERPDGIYYITPGGEEIPTGIRIVYGLNVFSEGFMPVISSENNKYGYVNARGEWAIPPQFSYADNFNKGRALASVESGTGMIDASGNWVLTPKYRNISMNLPGGDIILVTVNSSTIQLLDPITYQAKKSFKGKEIYCNTFYDNNLAVVYDAETTRLIDANGEEIMTRDTYTIYDTWSAMGDRVVVQMGVAGEMGAYLYTLKGEELFGPAQEIWFLGPSGGKNAYAYAIYEVEKQQEPAADWEGLWEIRETRTMGIIDENGENMIEAGPYKMITYGGDGAFVVETNNEIAIIDEEGNKLMSYVIDNE